MFHVNHMNIVPFSINTSICVILFLALKEEIKRMNGIFLNYLLMDTR